MLLTSMTIALASFTATITARNLNQQHPLADQSSANGIDAQVYDLIEKLKQAEIIPSILDTFTPQLSLDVSWPHATATLGSTISPSKMQTPPTISLTALSSRDAKPPPQLTLALTDPDAPSHTDPRWSQVCHWIATQLDPTSHVLNLTDIMPYKPPGPPPKTGKHRYVFVVLAPLNGTSERLELRKPSERFHWGFENKTEGQDGLRTWAEEMGLGVVGASFIYAQNEKQ